MSTVTCGYTEATQPKPFFNSPYSSSTRAEAPSDFSAFSPDGFQEPPGGFAEWRMVWWRSREGYCRSR